MFKTKLIRRWVSWSIAAGIAAFGSMHAVAVTCATQAELKDAERKTLADAALAMAASVQAGDVDGIKAKTIPSVAGNFSGMAGAVSSTSASLRGASLRVAAVYALDASDATPGQDEVQFFCGQAINGAHVTFSIPQLPAGRYAFVVVEATGIQSPERLSMLLQNMGSPAAASWELAGFFPRPLLAGGHDGVWHWQRARDFHKAGQNWNAYFYYQTAQYLLLPADFLSSNNLEKLGQEAGAALPAGLPGQTPMTLQTGATAAKITNLHTDASLGGLDLVISYDAADVSDPVQARLKAVSVMKAMLVMHPELKEGFHGLWVFANAPNQQPFSLELPLAQIQAQP